MALTEQNGRSQIPLRRSHPNLFLTVMMIGVADVVIGIGFLTIPPELKNIQAYKLVSQLMPIEWWGIVFLALGIVKLWATILRTYRVVRLVLVLGAAITSFWTLGFVYLGLIHAVPISSAGLWGVFSGIRYICLGEPPYNPATAELRRDDEQH